MGKRRIVRKPKKYWRLNHNIHAPQVRVIDEKGEQLGVLDIADALRKAREVEMDLVEIAAKAKPPVVKIADFGKFKYQEEKREKKQSKGAKKTDLKEVRFSPFIAGGDYNTRLGRIKEFLLEGHKIKIVVKFKGRQMGSKQFGYNLVKKLISELGEGIVTDMQPKFLGRHLVCIISPTSKLKLTKAEEGDEEKEEKVKKQK